MKKIGVMKRGLSTKEASIYLGISESKLRQCRMKKNQGRLKCPPFVRLGSRKILYLQDDLDHYLESKRVKTV